VNISSNTSLRKRFGDRIRSLRQASGLSQEAFADHCGFARSYMSRIERGRGNPSLDAIETLAVALRVEVQELFVSEKPAQGARKRATVRVPYAADGSCFRPDLRMSRSNRYHVGERDDPQEFDRFEDALAYLKKMDVAVWRRPNANGNWVLVRAVRWGSLA